MSEAEGQTRSGVILRGPVPVGCWLLDRDAQVPTEDGHVVDLARLDSPGAASRLLRRVWRVAADLLARPVPHGLVRDVVWVVTRDEAGIRCHVGAALPVEGLRGRGRKPRATIEVPFEAFASRLAALGERARRHDEMIGVLDGLIHVGSCLGSASSRLGAQLRGVAPFLETLDQEAIRRVGGGGDLPWGCYDGLDATVTPGAPLRRVVDARPHHAWLLCDAWRAGPDAFARHGEDGPDAILRSRVAEATGLPDSGMATVSAVHEAVRDLTRNARAWAARSVVVEGSPPSLARLPVELCRLAAAVHPSWRPRTHAEAATFVDAAPAVAYAAWACRNPGDVSAMLDAHGRWDGYGERVQPAEAASGPWSAHEVAGFVEDASRSFARQVLEPAVAMTRGRLATQGQGIMSEHASAALLWSGRSLPRVAEVVRRWHGAESGMLTQVMALPDVRGNGAASWKRHIPDHTADGMSLTILTDAVQLVEEGARGPDRDGSPGLAHCVGNYAPRCASGDCRIGSLRHRGPDGAWRRLSTVEFDVRGDAVTVLQHKGPENREPGPAESAMVAAYVRHLNGRDSRTRAIRPEPAPIGWSGASGYDVGVPGNWHAVTALWRPFLPRGLRDLEPWQWDALAALDVADPARGQPDFAHPLRRHWRVTPYSRADLAGAVPPRRPRWARRRLGAAFSPV